MAKKIVQVNEDAIRSYMAEILPSRTSVRSQLSSRFTLTKRKQRLRKKTTIPLSARATAKKSVVTNQAINVGS